MSIIYIILFQDFLTDFYFLQDKYSTSWGNQGVKIFTKNDPKENMEYYFIFFKQIQTWKYANVFLWSCILIINLPKKRFDGWRCWVNNYHCVMVVYAMDDLSSVIQNYLRLDYISQFEAYAVIIRYII